MKASFTFGFLTGMLVGVLAVKYVNKLNTDNLTVPLKQMHADSHIAEQLAAQSSAVETAMAQQIRSLREQLAQAKT